MTYKSPALKHCLQSTTDRLIVLTENGKKMVFQNDKRTKVKKVRVDGCAILQGKKCDWLVIDSQNVEHFVELKGIAILTGCEQLEVTIPQLSDDPANAAKHSYIVCGRVAPRLTTRLQTEKIKFKKQFNSTLIVKQNQHLVRI